MQVKDRGQDINLWDISKKSKVEKHFESIRRLMIPDEILMQEKAINLINNVYLN